MTKIGWGPYAPVHEALIEPESFGITNFPVDPIQVARYRGIRVRVYSQLATKANMTVDDFGNSVGSRDAIGKCEHGKAMICYNDTIESLGRQRFSIAHELGHIVLGHHVLSERERRRMNMSGTKPQYESDADCFARNLLSPAPVVEALGWDSAANVSLIAHVFGMSREAAGDRITRYIRADLNYLDAEYKQHICDCFRGSIAYWKALRTCTNCGRELHIQGARCCPICGSYDLMEKCLGDTMKYETIPLTASGRLEKCLLCGNDDIGDHEDFCRRCGKPVRNKCLGTESSPQFYHSCQTADLFSLPGDARFCPYCGSPTSFAAGGLLPEWNASTKDAEETNETESSEDDLGIDDLLF